MRNRHAIVAVAGLAVAAGCVWASSKMTWVQVTSEDGLGEARTEAIDGSGWAAASVPLAVVLIAAIAAVFAVPGRWALLGGVVVAAVGLGAAVPGVLMLLAGADSTQAGRIAELPARATVTGAETAVLPPLLAVIGGALAVVSAVVWAMRPSGLSAKYDAPAARRRNGASSTWRPADDETAQDSTTTQRSMWDALDAGIDPTADT